MKKYSPLLVIVILTIFFRFFWLADVPPSPSLDEVSIGWNAYSILETGGDEYGNKFPILLRAYDDWRPALYVYLVIPFIKLFGLNATSVRLPSVILSALTVLATYFLCLELFGKEKMGRRIAFWTSLTLAISPWHVYLSRLGHEVNPQVALTVFGLLSFLRFVRRKKPQYLFVSALWFALSFYTYQSQKIFGPLLLVSLGIIYVKELRFKWKTVLLAGIFGLILIVPMIRASLSPQALLRFEGTSLFNQNEELLKESALKLIDDKKNDNYLGLVLHNRRVVILSQAIKAYSSHFNPIWLFSNRGAESHKVPNLGLFYLWELPLMFLGLILLFKKKSLKKMRWVILSLIFLSPVSASITTDFPHAMRMFNAIPGPQMLTALGVVYLASFELWRRLKWGIGGIIVFSCLALFRCYFVNFPVEQSDSFQYPLKQAISYVIENEGDYERIVFSNKDNTFQSYMFFLFYSKFDPVEYQQLGGTISGGFAESHQIGKFEFVSSEKLKKPEELEENVLLVGNYNRLGDKGQIFRSLDGEPEIVMIER